MLIFFLLLLLLLLLFIIKKIIKKIIIIIIIIIFLKFIFNQDMFRMKHHPSSVVQWEINWSWAINGVTKSDITWMIKDEGENRIKTRNHKTKKSQTI